jgi:hypothetical protein
MNAGGVPNTCKSSGDNDEFTLNYLSGGRVSNAWATYLIQGDNSEKLLLKPHTSFWSHDFNEKNLLV